MKAYIYPNSKRGNLNNPYLHNFIGSVSGDIEFVNYEKAARFGIADIFFYSFKIDIIFFNWLEDVLDKRFGKIQWLILSMFILPILKMRKVKIVWVLHNVVSHNKKNKEAKEIIFNKLFLLSDFIITHAWKGVELIKERGAAGKIIFFHHPINQRNRYSSEVKEIDIFIWGYIAPYKGIHDFLDQVNKSEILKNFNIVIAGEIIDKEYELILERKLTPNIKLIKRFLKDEELEDYLSRSKITLFPYNETSVLSSGALADSLGFGNIIIGPDIGAFKDLRVEKILYSYKNVSEISQLCERILNNYHKYKVDDLLISDYLEKHSWGKFAEVVREKIKS